MKVRQELDKEIYCYRKILRERKICYSIGIRYFYQNKPLNNIYLILKPIYFNNSSISH